MRSFVLLAVLVSAVALSFSSSSQAAAECGLLVNSSEHGGVAALASVLFDRTYEPILPAHLQSRLASLNEEELRRIGEGHLGSSEDLFQPLYRPGGALNSRVVMRLRSVAFAWRLRLRRSEEAVDQRRARLIEASLVQSYPLVRYYNQHPECRDRSGR